VEGLRALAAGSILVFHTWAYASPGEEQADLGRLGHWLIPELPLGVTLFFVLSGFLLYRPFAAALMRDRARPSIRRYLTNRALRILPAYWFILLAVAFVLQTALVHTEPWNLEPQRLDDPVLLARNALLVQNYGDPSQGSFFTGIGPAWSLAVEAVFYVTLPLLVLLGFALRRERARIGARLAALAPVALMLFLGLASKLAIYLLGEPLSTAIYWSFLGNADKFAFGMAVAVAFVDVEDKRLRLPRWWPAVGCSALIAVAFPASKLMRTGWAGSPASNYLYNTLMALACGLLLALVVLPRNENARLSLLARLLETRLLVAAGIVSYSVFLWHEPVIYWLRVHGLTLSGAEGFAFNLLLVVFVVAVLSALTYRWVELPALRLKSRGVKADVPAAQLQAAP
jgi:peptidoglycan/LPS O-acetylase OafA/YrhL